MANRVFIGYSSKQSVNLNTTLTDIDLIKQDIMNHFSIKKGEKLENPNFGSIIPYLVFEPFTNDIVTAIEDEVERVISFDPRCQLNIIDVRQNLEANGIIVECNITFKDFAKTLTVSWETLSDGSIRML